MATTTAVKKAFAGSWKTTVGGFLVALGTGITATFPDWEQIGLIIAGLGGLLTGVTARDNNKTSEDVCAVPKPNPTCPSPAEPPTETK